MTDTREYEPDWERLREQILETWSKLTDDDVDLIQNDDEALVQTIYQAYGQSTEEIWAELNRIRAEVDGRPEDGP